MQYYSFNDVQVQSSVPKIQLNGFVDEVPQQKMEQFKDVHTYTFRTIDFSNVKQKQKFEVRQQEEIKSINNLASLARIDTIDKKPSNKTTQDKRMEFMYENINYGNNNHEMASSEVQIIGDPIQLQQKIIFNKYSQAQSDSTHRIKTKSEYISSKQHALNFTYGLSIIESNLTEKPNFLQINVKQKSNQVDQYRKKVITLQRELTQMTLQKGELIIQLADLQRQNCDLKRQMKKLQQTKMIAIPFVNANEGKKKIEIEEDLFYQIQNIGQQQKEINKIKEEYIKLASAGYESQIKKLLQQNHAYKIQIQTLKVDLEMAKQDLKQKQLKIQFLQKEKSNLEQKTSNNSNNSTQSNEKINQIISLKHNLDSLEKKYRTLTRELRSKEDYILKYLTNRRGSHDLQAVKGLVYQAEYYGLKQSDHISQVESQFQVSSQIGSLATKNVQEI